MSLGSLNRLAPSSSSHFPLLLPAGTHLSFPEIRDCLLQLDDTRLTVEQLKALLKAVPSDAEREALSAYLQVTGLRDRYPMASTNQGVCGPTKVTLT